jgi:hypothetical protein
MYAYVFRYDASAFDGVPVQAFRRALAAELGTGIGGVYEPLNHSSLYQPHTKRRYRLNEDHWRAIDPARFHTPIAEHAFAQESVVISQPHLLAGRPAIQAIVEACAKLHTQQVELAAWAASLSPAEVSQTDA